MVEVIFRERLDKDLAVSLIAQRAIGLQKLDTHKDVRVPIARVDQFSPDIGPPFLLKSEVTGAISRSSELSQITSTLLTPLVKDSVMFAEKGV